MYENMKEGLRAQIKAFLDARYDRVRVSLADVDLFIRYILQTHEYVKRGLFTVTSKEEAHSNVILYITSDIEGTLENGEKFHFFLKMGTMSCKAVIWDRNPTTKNDFDDAWKRSMRGM